MKKENKYYLVVSQKNNRIHGAFPKSKEGKEKAKIYAENNSTPKNKLKVTSK